MTRATLLKLGLLTSLYFAQGLPFGFFTQALPVLLREQGVSLTKIGLSSLLALPWALKFLWAPLVDRHGDRRRWILGLNALGVALLCALAFFPPDLSLAPLLVAVALTNLVAATQDVAADGLAVDVLAPEERGWGNGIQVAGYRAGMILGGGVILAAFPLLGWRLALWVLAVGLALTSVPVYLTREPPRAAPPQERSLLLAALRRPGVPLWLLLLGGFKAGDALGAGMLRPYLVDRGLSLPEIGAMLGIVGFVAGLLGALAGGGGVSLLGRRRALLAFGLLQASGMAAWGVCAWLGEVVPIEALWAVCGYEHFAGGTATAALFTVMMDSCEAEQAATDYTLQACAVVIATGAAASLGGALADALGYPGLFLVATLGAVAGAFALVRAGRVQG
ncbi:MAG: MFS transporter [Planctomycetota bacterium]